MDLRIYASAQIRKGLSMSKAPDLSAFPIPRKGGARPIEADDAPEPTVSKAPDQGGQSQPSAPSPAIAIVATPGPALVAPRKSPQRHIVKEAPTPSPSGQTIASTVKLDENRYLRLAEAGRPGPGHLKRRTIQEMVIEALDEWFEKRHF